MDSESIANFCSITDASDTTAEYFMNAAGGDLDIAIGLFYESGGGEANTSTSANRSNIHEISAEFSDRNNMMRADEDEDVVLPPRSVPPARSQIVLLSDSEDENGEEVIMKTEQVEDVIFNTSNTSSSTARRLADLFRPPHAIMFNGSLELARRHARTQNRWILLTIHAPTDFASQAMNRDLWNAPLLQSFVKDNFVFVQMIVGGGEEKRYSSFYPYDGLYPHVAIIDPRTGERVETLLISSIPVPGFKLVPTDRDLLEILGDFLAENSLDPLTGGKRSRSDEPESKRKDLEDLEAIADIADIKESEAIAAIKIEAITSTSITSNTTNTANPLTNTANTTHDQYDGSDAIHIQFRLPTGQKHRHRFNPRTLSIPVLFQTAAAVSQIPLGQFQLRTAETELVLEDEGEVYEIKKLHNTMITIIK